MPLLFTRLREQFFSEIIISFISVLIIQAGFIPETVSCIVPVMAICLIINTIYNIRCLTDYLLYVDDLIIYLKTNLTVLLIFTLTSGIMALADFEPLYTYLFFPYKIGMFLGSSKAYSVFSVNAISLIITLIIPFTKEKTPV